MRFLSLNFWCRTNASNKTFQSMQPLVDKLHSPKASSNLRPTSWSLQIWDWLPLLSGSISNIMCCPDHVVTSPPSWLGCWWQMCLPSPGPQHFIWYDITTYNPTLSRSPPLLHSTVNYDFVAATVYTGKCTNIPPDILISLIFTKILGHLTLTSAAPER